MFVRWKRRVLKTRRYQGEQAHYAVLVKSVRVAGQPRQQVIAYLARLIDSRMSYPATPFDFWGKVLPKLDALNLPEVERAKIESALGQVVRRPLPAEFEQHEAEFQKFLAVAREMFGGQRRSAQASPTSWGCGHYNVVPKNGHRFPYLGTTQTKA